MKARADVFCRYQSEVQAMNNELKRKGRLVLDKNTVFTPGERYRGKLMGERMIRKVQS